MPRTITVGEFREKGAPAGTRVFLPTFHGAVRIDYAYDCGGLWVHAPEDNAGFGMSYAVHRGTALEVREEEEG